MSEHETNSDGKRDNAVSCGGDVQLRGISLCGLLLLCAGCRRDPHDDDRFRTIAATRARQATQLSLSRMAHGVFQPLVPSLHVRVTMAGVSLDNASEMAAWAGAPRTEAIRSIGIAEPEAYPIVRERVVPATNGVAEGLSPSTSLVLRALSEQVNATRQLAARYWQFIPRREFEETTPTVTLFVERTVPVRLLTQVLFTLGQAGYSKLHFAVQTPAHRVEAFEWNFPSMGVARRSPRELARQPALRAGTPAERAAAAAEAALALQGSRPAYEVPLADVLPTNIVDLAVEYPVFLRARSQGVVVRLGVRRLAVGCTALAPQESTELTLASNAEMSAVSACLRAFQGAVRAQGQSPYESAGVDLSEGTAETSLQLMVAARFAPDGSEVYPYVDFGVGPR